MPGSDDDPDKIQTYGQDNSGKSKTSQIAPDQIGRPGVGTTGRLAELIDENDGQPFETLREAGFETGDFVATGPTLGPQGSQDGSTAQSTFDSLTTVINTRVNFDRITPSNGTVAVALDATLNAGSTTGSAIRLFNNTDGETIIEGTGFTSDLDVSLGPVEYSPTTTSAPVTVLLEIRSDGTNTVDLFLPRAEFGVIL